MQSIQEQTRQDIIVRVKENGVNPGKIDIVFILADLMENYADIEHSLCKLERLKEQWRIQPVTQASRAVFLKVWSELSQVVHEQTL
ncbi:hypothetical protein AALO_G00101220 [Alosa alosa]|uniref:Uncharacterized protein n=1 Tax=Alosa alosa TaxID=278164 RepID=A0AAV6GYT8_9TELE|nr:hypothetical protein AALO_G00101220 [Alosa alosa]